MYDLIIAENKRCDENNDNVLALYWHTMNTQDGNSIDIYVLVFDILIISLASIRYDDTFQKVYKK
jgi:hypothetical protein